MRHLICLLVLAFFLSPPAVAMKFGESCGSGEEEVSEDSPLMPFWQKNKIWKEWIEKIRVEFPKRVNLLYASTNTDKSKIPARVTILMEIDTRTGSIGIASYAAFTNSLYDNQLLDFCKTCSEKLEKIPTLKPPSVSSANKTESFALWFNNKSALDQEVKLQSLDSRDIDCLLQLDSGEIKEILNLPPEQLRSRLDDLEKMTPLQ